MSSAQTEAEALRRGLGRGFVMGDAAVCMQRAREDEAGFTVAEIAIAAALLFVVTLSVMGALSSGARSHTISVVRQQALELANSKLEEARNMSFTDLGTIGGSPVGTVPANLVQGRFTITTQITQDIVHGPFYKNIVITVSWTTPVAGSVRAETGIFNQAGPVAINNGNLIVHVRDAGNANAFLPGATAIVDPSLGDAMTLQTDTSGTATFAYVPSGQTALYVDLDGYVFNCDPFASILVTPTITNEVTISGYRSSTCTVHVKDINDADISGALVTLLSDDSTLTTDANGNAQLGDLYPQVYSFLVESTGRSSFNGSFLIPSGNSSITTEVVLPSMPPSLTVTVLDANTGQPISDARVVAVGPNPSTNSYVATSNASGLAMPSVPATTSNVGYTVSAAKGSAYPTTVTVSGVGYGPAGGATTIRLTPYTPGTLTVYTRHIRDGSARRNVLLHIWSDTPLWDNGSNSYTDWSGSFSDSHMQPGVTYHVQPVSRTSRRRGHRLVALAPQQDVTFGGTSTLTFSW